MKVKCLQSRVVDDHRKGTKDEERFEAGKVYDLPDASARRWISRGVMEPLEAPAPKSDKPADAPKADKPAGKPRGSSKASKAAADKPADAAASSDADEDPGEGDAGDDTAERARDLLG